MEDEAGKKPFEELHVYAVEGGEVTGADEAELGESFLGTWVEGRSSFLFFSRDSDTEVFRILKGRPDLEFRDKYYFTYEQWQGAEESTVKVGPFEIVRPWIRQPPDPGRRGILLDPGLVFGNGVHPTTQDCLRALTVAAGHRPFRRVMDLGTGTGLLALAAAYLGAEKVVAVDINPLCVKTALKNVELNDLGDYIRVFQGPAEDYLEEQAELLIANIHYEAMVRILKYRSFRAQERIILSGLMRSQWREIRARLEREGYAILRQWDHDMTWFTLLAEKV